MSSTEHAQLDEIGRAKSVVRFSDGIPTKHDTDIDKVVSIPSKVKSRCKGKSCYCKKHRGDGVWRVPFLL